MSGLVFGFLADALYYVNSRRNNRKAIYIEDPKDPDTHRDLTSKGINFIMIN